MKVLILGHTGMLGDAVSRYFKTFSFEIEVLPVGMRWPSIEMIKFIQDSKASWIINCIGAIPQRNPKDYEYFELNAKLPLFLFSQKGKKILHAATDCEFSGNLPANDFYDVNDYPDAKDLYGLSKAIPTEFVRYSFPENVKVIRASIIGIEPNSNVSLLNWFLSSIQHKNPIKGYNNHFWNGITTLEWAKIAVWLIENNIECSILQPAVEKLSKYELLKKMAEVFKPDYYIEEISHSKYQNKCLCSNLYLRNIDDLLMDLKKFYSL